MKIAGTIAFCRIYSTDLRRKCGDNRARNSAGSLHELQLATFCPVKPAIKAIADSVPMSSASHSNEHDRLLHSAVSFIYKGPRGIFVPDNEPTLRNFGNKRRKKSHV